jgi:hypothetical protein
VASSILEPFMTDTFLQQQQLDFPDAESLTAEEKHRIAETPLIRFTTSPLMKLPWRSCAASTSPRRGGPRLDLAFLADCSFEYARPVLLPPLVLLAADDIGQRQPRREVRLTRPSLARLIE